ncbi:MULTISPECIES: VIT1/CCC1 transporter family protein [Anaerolinea]|uniref:VIT1/CCC1 transporter family protein n=1 Tax=Anaerolinea TaxID=233189 RepID=UPI0026282F11|nr:VIT1/CCC1 transporter family protein [Anaerolinea thermophila]
MSFSKRLEDARKGFLSGKPELSAQAHDLETIRRAMQHRERHASAGSEYLGSMVYGGLDGIITTFAVVSGVAGAGLKPEIIIILGLANVFADGFSMAVGAYLSEKSEMELYERERQRESWEVEYFPEAEKEELRQLYLAQGYPEEDANQMVEIKTRDKTRWVDAMMLEELNLLPADTKPLTSALVTFGAFVIAGLLPMMVFLLDWLLPFTLSGQSAFWISVGVSALALFGLGAAKVLVTERPPLRSGLEMLVVGGLAAAVAYLVGMFLRSLGLNG